MGIKKWQDASSGPDWTDVLITMRAIEDCHKVSVGLTLVPGVFAGPAGMLTIHVRSVSGDASVMGSYVAAISGEWPCKEHSTMESCVYAGLLAIDWELTPKLPEQKTLT